MLRRQVHDVSQTVGDVRKDTAARQVAACPRPSAVSCQPRYSVLCKESLYNTGKQFVLVGHGTGAVSTDVT